MYKCHIASGLSGAHKTGFNQSYYLQMYSVDKICKDRDSIRQRVFIEVYRFIEGQASSP